MESNRPSSDRHPELDADVTLDFITVERDLALIDFYSAKAEEVRDAIRTSQPPDLYARSFRVPFVHYVQSLGYMAYIGKNLVLRHYAGYLEEKAEYIRDVYWEQSGQE